MLNNLERGVCWKDSKHLDTCISGEEMTEKYPKYIVIDSKDITGKYSEMLFSMKTWRVKQLKL